MKLRVYKNQYGYSTLAKNGEDKMYVSIQFKKGNEPQQDTADIRINNAFFSMYKNKNGYAQPKLVIMDYEIENKDEQIEREGIQNEQDYQVDFSQDLPF